MLLCGGKDHCPAHFAGTFDAEPLVRPVAGCRYMDVSSQHECRFRDPMATEQRASRQWIWNGRDLGDRTKAVDLNVHGQDRRYRGTRSQWTRKKVPACNVP